MIQSRSIFVVLISFVVVTNIFLSIIAVSVFQNYKISVELHHYRQDQSVENLCAWSISDKD